MAKRKETTYGKLSKLFTKINNKLPEEKKVSISLRRKIIKEQILPQFKGVPPSKVRIRDAKAKIISVYEKVKLKEICDINYISPSVYSLIKWFELDEFISQRLPECIYVRVSAGDFGQTKIFNTLNYDYFKNGVRDIVEEIRIAVDNESGLFFVGVPKLRPRRLNNGIPENYFLDIILHINEMPVDDDTPVRFKIVKSKKSTKAKRDVKSLLSKKLGELKSKKLSRKRAKVTLKKNITKFKKIKSQVKKAKKPSINKQLEFQKQFNKAIQLLDKYYAEGKLTKAQYEQALKQIIYKDGGEINN
jgi:hypothetical protein